MATILIVDDSKFSRGRVVQALSGQPYELAQAADGQEALKMVDQIHPDLIITDLLMPVLDGFGLLRGLIERQLQTPTIVISADIQATTRATCRSLGAVAFLNKPFQPDEVTNAVRNALGAVAEVAR